MPTATAPKAAAKPAEKTDEPKAEEKPSEEPTGPEITVANEDFDFASIPSGRGRRTKLNEFDVMIQDFLSNPAPRIVAKLDTDEEVKKFSNNLRNAADRCKAPPVKLIWRYVPEDHWVNGKPHPAAGKHVWILTDKEGNALPGPIQTAAAKK